MIEAVVVKLIPALTVSVIVAAVLLVFNARRLPEESTERTSGLEDENETLGMMEPFVLAVVPSLQVKSYSKGILYPMYNSLGGGTSSTDTRLGITVIRMLAE